MADNVYYDEVSNSYDEQRATMGSDVMVSMIQLHCGKPLKDIHVLDAGCGTGNYAMDFIRHGVGQLTLFDSSSGMLEIAYSKLSKYIQSERIKDVIEGKLPVLPFAESTFDAVMFNLVLHHLEIPTTDGHFKKTIDTLTEAKRVLTTHGMIIISTGLPYIFKQSIWFKQINAQLTDRFVKLYPNMEQWENIFESSGLKCIQKINILGPGVLKDYYNFEGPLDENWRRGNMYWEFATTEEIADVRSHVLKLREMGNLEKWARTRDHVDSTGLLTVFMLTQANNYSHV